MARFKKVHTPAYVSAYRPGIDRTPPWVKQLKVTKRFLKFCKPGDWLVRDITNVEHVTRYTKAEFSALYVHDA